jgi:Putative MetA-pathway of phenol degradation
MKARGGGRQWFWAVSIALNLGSLSLAATCRGGQPLETETARLVRRGSFEVEMGVEHQSSSQGTELALPFAIAYGLSNRVELLVEPVPFSSIHDKGLPSANGVGDVEVTLTGLLVSERGHRPAFAVAGECKVPTAQNSRIGSGETDYTVYGIGSKRIGRWDTHLNLGYTWVGSPPGTQVNNVQSFGLAEEFQASPRAEVVGEIFGNSAALSEGNGEAGAGSESQVTPEIGGAELVGALGLRYHPDGGIIYTLGVSYDNNSAFLIHPGVTVKW